MWKLTKSWVEIIFGKHLTLRTKPNYGTWKTEKGDEESYGQKYTVWVSVWLVGYHRIIHLAPLPQSKVGSPNFTFLIFKIYKFSKITNQSVSIEKFSAGKMLAVQVTIIVSDKIVMRSNLMDESNIVLEFKI